MVKLYNKKYLSVFLLVCMLIQIFIPSLAIAEEINYNSNGVNNIYAIKNDTNITIVKNEELKCMHGKTQYEPCTECGILVHSDKNIALIGYEQDFFDSILPPDDVDEEDLDLYKLHSIRLTCLHGSADGTYCDECKEIVNITADSDYISCVIMDSCIHGKVKGEKCNDCKILKENQDDYELMEGENWDDPLIYAVESTTYIVSIKNSGFPSYDYECSLCGFYLGNDTAWINNVHHCCDPGCSVWAKPSDRIEIRGTCDDHEGRVVLQGGHHLGWVKHYGSGSHNYQTYDVEYETIEPTCTVDGAKKTICHKRCSNCDATTTVVTSTTKIDKLGHDYKATGTEEKITEATCQTSGKKESIETQVCSRCGDIKNVSTIIQTFEQLPHNGKCSYKDTLSHSLECEGVNTVPHTDVEKHKFVLDENGEDYFCEMKNLGCDAYKTTIHYDAYVLENGEDKLVQTDIGASRITNVYSESLKNIVSAKYEATTRYPNTLENENGLYKAIDKDSQPCVVDLKPGGIRLKVYYEDITQKSGYVVEYYKQVEKEVQGTIIQSYELADTDTGEYKIGGEYNAVLKEYEGYKLVENQVTSLVINENSDENVLKIYYNKSENDFSVWLPSAIYIDIDENGNVTVQDNPAIFNAVENRSIAIKEVKLRGVNGWSFSDNALELKDKQTTPVGTKKLAITLNNDPVKVNSENDTEATVVLTPDNWVIAANSFLPLNIGAVVADQAQDIVSNHVFTMDFVAGWDKAESSVNNYMITLAKSEEGGLADDSIDCILAIEGKVPSIPDAIPNDSDMKFVGWFVLGSDTDIKDLSTINENITIEPRFALKDGVNKLVVNFVADAGGAITGNSSVKVASGTYWGAITKPTVTANKGYEFDGWYNTDGEKITSTTQILWNQTVTAKFSKIDMTAYFTYDGNTVTGLSDTYLNMVNAPTDLVLPTNAGGQNLTDIGVGAFKNRNLLTSIVIPKNYNYIHSSAFEGCNNADIYIEGDSIWYWLPEYSSNGKNTYNMKLFGNWRWFCLYSRGGNAAKETFERTALDYGAIYRMGLDKDYTWYYYKSKTFNGVKSIHVKNLNAINSNFILAEIIWDKIPIYINEKLKNFSDKEIGIFTLTESVNGSKYYRCGYLVTFLDSNEEQIPIEKYYNSYRSNIYEAYPNSPYYVASQMISNKYIKNVTNLCGWSI